MTAATDVADDAEDLPRCINRCGGRARKEGRGCRRCWTACRRKTRYAFKERAWAELERLRPDPVDDPTLSIYRCRILSEHWHVGHAGGRRGKILRKRVEKARRKSLWKISDG